MLPQFQLDLLFLTPQDLRSVPRVEVLDIFDGVSKNFHPRGLFSVENFGRVGEIKRNRLFGYIELNTTVLHPVLYKILCDLKSLYSDIMHSKEYAVFDNKIKDFVKSDPLKGRTGYSFFLEHLPSIKFEQRASDKRETYITTIYKYLELGTFMMDKLVVLPAGHRDYLIDDSGKPSEDEINPLYRGVLGMANTIAGVGKSANIEYLDSMRINLQNKILQIYIHIVDIFDGKNKFGQSKFSTRKIFNSTRNIITSTIPRHNHLLSKRRTSVNQTRVGLYQYLVANFPIVAKQVRDGFLSQVFTGPSSPAIGVNVKTLKKEIVRGIEEDYDMWMTMEGFEKTLQNYGVEEYRHEPVMVKDCYIGLIYKDDTSFMLLQDIDDLPKNLDAKKVSPISFTELLYIAVEKEASIAPNSVTRYPVAEQGSMYFAYTYLITTTNSISLFERNAAGEITDREYAEFPIHGSPFFNAMCPSPTHLGKLNGDFDGDMTNFIGVFTDEAREEIHDKLNSAGYYKSARGDIAYSCSEDIADLVMSHLFN